MLDAWESAGWCFNCPYCPATRGQPCRIHAGPRCGEIKREIHTVRRLRLSQYLNLTGCEVCGQSELIAGFENRVAPYRCFTGGWHGLCRPCAEAATPNNVRDDRLDGLVVGLCPVGGNRVVIALRRGTVTE